VLLVRFNQGELKMVDAKKVLFGLMLLPIMLFSQTPAKIYVYAEAEDNVGSRLVYRIKEMIRASNNTEIASIKEESDFQINIITLDKEKDEYKGKQCVYSVVWTATASDSREGLKYFLSSSVGVCGSNQIGTAAESLVAETDRLISDITEHIIKSLKNNSK
jgi:hypothetical protein